MEAFTVYNIKSTAVRMYREVVDLKNWCGSSKHCGRECYNTSVLRHRLVKTNCYIMMAPAYRSYHVFTAVLWLNVLTFQRNILPPSSGWLNWFKWMLQWHRVEMCWMYRVMRGSLGNHSCRRGSEQTGFHLSQQELIPLKMSLCRASTFSIYKHSGMWTVTRGTVYLYVTNIAVRQCVAWGVGDRCVLKECCCFLSFREWVTGFHCLL